MKSLKIMTMLSSVRSWLTVPNENFIFIMLLNNVKWLLTSCFHHKTTGTVPRFLKRQMHQKQYSSDEPFFI